MKRRELEAPPGRPGDSLEIALRREECRQIRREAVEAIGAKVPGTRYHDLFQVTIWQLGKLAESDDPDPVEARAQLEGRRRYRGVMEGMRAPVEAGNAQKGVGQ